MRHQLAPVLLAAVSMAAVGAQPVQARQDGAAALYEAGYERGDPAAPLVIVEFVDFACSACAKFARETMPHLEREWIATGRARYVVVPFDVFRTGRNAAVAAECAARQDAFWPMHDLLYERQKEWLGKRKQQEKFDAWATELGLDVDRFSICQEDKSARKRFESNKKLAKEYRVPGTPTFVVGDQLIIGALKYEQFAEALERIAASGKREPTRRLPT